MAYNSISTKHYIKSHLELQREITLIELAPSPYFFVSSICLAYMNMFARFDENPAMTCLTADPGVASSIPARSHTFVEIDHEIISTVILLPSADSFKKGCCQLQAKVCAQITG